MKVECQVFILIMEQMGCPSPEGPSREQSKAGSSSDKQKGPPKLWSSSNVSLNSLWKFG